MCNQIHDDEWSGTLFYKIKEGDIGTDHCVLSAEYLILQDIGNSVYTEYEFDGEFVKVLMQMPHLLQMNKGHIHSHNKMAVFFSGTDDKELIDNSGFHNYYFSLIVNNRNDMCAKVAFRVNKVSEINTTLEYNDSKGNKKTTKAEPTTNTEIAVYAYNCDIVKPVIIDEVMNQRYDVVTTTAKAKADLMKKEVSKHFTPAPQGKGEQGVKTFDWDKEQRKYDEGKKAKKYGFEKDWEEEWYNGVPIDRSSKQQEFGFDKGERMEKGSKQDRKKLVGSQVDKRTYNFLTRLLSNDLKCSKTLREILANLDEELNTVWKTNQYADEISKFVVDFYIDSFPEDINFIKFEDIMQDCIEILENGFEDTFPVLIEELVIMLNLEIK